MSATDLSAFVQDIWYIAISFAVLLGIGFGVVFWWLVLKD